MGARPSVPDEPLVAVCGIKGGGCGATVIWLKPVNGDRPAPVDPQPVPDGNVVIPRPGFYKVLTKREIDNYNNPGMLDDPAPPRYKLHFATCPNAEHFRRCKKCHETPCQCRKAS